jgi:hypothetical protein
VDPVLWSLQREGLLKGDQRIALGIKVREMISRPGIADWFCGENGCHIYNERSILSGNGKLYRPDRVIVKDERVTLVDFKFGKVEKSTYVTQVKNYIQQLEEMDYTHVVGYVWYVILDKIVKVDRS